MAHNVTFSAVEPVDDAYPKQLKPDKKAIRHRSRLLDLHIDVT
jgi:hypothetical protein